MEVLGTLFKRSNTNNTKWFCKNCETENYGEYCTVCGQPRPSIFEGESKETTSVCTNEEYVSTNNKDTNKIAPVVNKTTPEKPISTPLKGKKRTTVIIGTIIFVLLVLFLIVVFVESSGSAYADFFAPEQANMPYDIINLYFREKVVRAEQVRIKDCL